MSYPDITDSGDPRDVTPPPYRGSSTPTMPSPSAGGAGGMWPPGAPPLPPSVRIAPDLQKFADQVRSGEEAAAQLRLIGQLLQVPPGPGKRISRSAKQQVLALLASIPLSVAALKGAGVDVDPQIAAIATGVPTALGFTVAAVWNLVDRLRGKG